MNGIPMNAAGSLLAAAYSCGDAALIASLRRELDSAQKALQASDKRFQELVESINGVFWTTDVTGSRLYYVSPGYERIWGRSCKELYAAPLSWIETIHPDDRQRVLGSLPNGAPRSSDQEFRVVRPDGSIRWVRAKTFPSRDCDGIIDRYMGLVEDITDARRLEEQIRQSQKMDAIGTLAGGIAHDFNNILSVISGHTDLLRMAVPKESAMAQHVEEVKQAGTRAARLVRQILTFSRREETQWEKVHMGQLVEEALRFLRATIPTTIQFKTTLSSKVPAVMADSTQVHQVLLNLGTNAWHAMRESHGTLEVQVHAVELDSDTARVQARLQPGHYVRITMSDSGIGMNKETVDRIFEPYFTTKPKGEGTGLGLSVVHGIMRSHNGSITVSSQLGKGTTFQLYFPALPEHIAEQPVHQAPVVRGNGERILFVDDEESIVFVGEKMLTLLNYKVEATSSVAYALELLRADAERFDLVITDLAMPEMTGIEFAREIAKVRAGLPVILMTGNPGSLSLSEVRSKGIRELLVKPPNAQTLSETVQKALADRPTA